MMTGCDAKKHAARLVRRAVNECPELVQVKAHPIDTALTAPAFTDIAHMPLREVTGGATVCAPTEHGTVVVSLSRPDSTLVVDFVASPRTLRYRDTVRFAQVTVPPAAPAAPEREKGEGSLANAVAIWLVGLAIGAFAVVYLFRTGDTDRRKHFE